MSEAWYRAAGAEEPLTQGDIIFECPALSWKVSALQQPAGSVVADLSLGEHVIAEARDLVVSRSNIGSLISMKCSHCHGRC
jgi:hypothetical protein